MKLVLFAFASSDLKRSANRLESQAIESKFYDDVKIISFENLDKNTKDIISSFIIKNEKKGFGYWVWKPLIVQNILNQINYGDVINYMDVGCHIIKKNFKRFNNYINLIKEKDRWILPFQYHSKLECNIENINFPKREEQKYTKADLLNYYNFLNDVNIVSSPQFWAGCFFIKKTKKSLDFINEWLDVFYNKFYLINDSLSKIENLQGFVENRHDQSVFSLLCKKYNLESISAYECDWAILNNQRTWQHNLDSPILAKRDLKYNLFKRFLNRQTKNLKRLKRKIFFNNY